MTPLGPIAEAGEEDARLVVRPPPPPRVILQWLQESGRGGWCGWVFEDFEGRNPEKIHEHQDHQEKYRHILHIDRKS
jgi:hypothetical protein